MSKSSRKGKKHTNDSRQNSAKEAFVKRLKHPKARASKAQLTELTTELNTRFAEVQALSHTPTAPIQPVSHSQIEQESVRGLAEVLRGL
ncbi:hypothetical protein PHLCEN_2v298 [Hermanssonia centrifuga]|uniref:Uncharacterized protein n=1 Tax=Hermanssonia centrifuga TaxID=98765 RepID=A0A2R6S6A5_9APHY|nr:hypothetical protein PHLCEN_2v298 [Hermanssonia centrifuga]